MASLSVALILVAGLMHDSLDCLHRVAITQQKRFVGLTIITI